MLELLKRRDLELPPEKRREAAIRAYSTIHALKVLELLETQGPDAVHTYVKNLRERMAQRRTASAAEFLENQNVTRALQLVDQIIAQRIDHPKIPKLTELVERSLREGARRIMIFTNYRSTAARLVETLNDLGGPIAAIRLVGQASKTDDKGLSQKEQTLILDDFKTGAYNVLIATQVGEEGLDIVECDHVIFYDTVSSAIRYIQRRGRTGRRGPGRVTVLAAAGTRDEAYYWIARRREKDMAEVLNRITKDEEKVQPSLDEFVKRSPLPREGEARVKIVADVRETPSQVLRQLSRYQVTLEMRSLLYGDFILSDRVAVERKSSDDLATSIIDGRLFEQAANLKSQYERPILLIEGETLASSRNMNPASIMGAVASLLVDYQLPVVWTTDPAETALLLYSIARREQTESAREPRIRSEKRITSPTWLQEFIVAGLPHVDVTLAKRLLQRFKTVEGIFTASTRELQEVEGIGDKKSKRIREILTREYTPE